MDPMNTPAQKEEEKCGPWEIGCVWIGLYLFCIGVMAGIGVGAHLVFLVQ